MDASCWGWVLASGGGQGVDFGYPADKPITRYLEALEIIVPLLRGVPSSTFDGEFHRVKDACPASSWTATRRLADDGQPSGKRTMTAAAKYADVWSAYATPSSLPEAFATMTGELGSDLRVNIGRDPTTIGRSVGAFVEPGDAKSTEATGFGVAISGSIDQIAGDDRPLRRSGRRASGSDSLAALDRHGRAVGTRCSPPLPPTSDCRLFKRARGRGILCCYCSTRNKTHSPGAPSDE